MSASDGPNLRYRVLSMQAGFGLVESSFTRKMNSANIMTKNMLDLVLSAFVYVFLGCTLLCLAALPGTFVTDANFGNEDRNDPASFSFAYRIIPPHFPAPVLHTWIWTLRAKVWTCVRTRSGK